MKDDAYRRRIIRMPQPSERYIYTASPAAAYGPFQLFDVPVINYSLPVKY